MKLDKNQVLSGMYFAGLMALCVGLPLSKFLMSLSQFFLGASWFLSLRYKEKLTRFINNPAAILLTAVFVMHAIGLFWSTDIKAGLDDTRIKVPLFVLPFVISTMPPLTHKQFKWLKFGFVLSVLIATLISTAVWLGYTSRKVNDTRDIAVGISHIRFSLMICLAIFMLIHAIFKVKEKKYKIAFTLSVTWLITFLAILESVTGFVVFGVVGSIILLYFTFKKGNVIAKIIVPLIIIAIPASLFIYAKMTINEYRKQGFLEGYNLEKYTPRGNPYEHLTYNQEMENGHRMYLYVSMNELYESWNKRSKINYFGKDSRDQYIQYTLIRFLTSKGLRKDADGVRVLSEEEVHAIENGITSVNYLKDSSVKFRLNQIIWEYYDFNVNNDPSGHSVMQRFEFWKAGYYIIKKNWLIGVGTGDVKRSFDRQYNKMRSPLHPKFRHHAHNQYMSIFVTFGIVGFLLFLTSIVYPLIYKKKYRDYLYVVFWLILVISMMSEDTLETQAGATFYAFFNSLFLFGNNKEKETDPKVKE